MQPDDLSKNVYLTSMRDRNEVLFFRLLSDHLEEMLPIVYTPTIGEAIQRYSHWYNKPRGIYLSIDDPDAIERSLLNCGIDGDDVDLIVTTDSEGILGIGDQGVGGVQTALGKLSVYSAAGGIHPHRAIPVVLDVGTDNLELLSDEFYLGVRHPRTGSTLRRVHRALRRDGDPALLARHAPLGGFRGRQRPPDPRPVSYTHLR